ncbi:MAG: NADH-quinone oxidoreductase subunit N [Chloroflexi bacterium]|nr:MAG: NADH-quinone oxidoreductase subunit N [Chloroflexota bacterium]
MFEAPEINLYVLAPFIIVAGWAILLMVIDLFVSDEKKQWATGLTLVGMVAALIVTLMQWNNGGETFLLDGHPMVVLDNFALFVNGTLLLTGIFAILISTNFMRENGLERPEYYMLMLFSLSGMMLMGMANDLILIFLALELLSIPLYIMSGFAWPREDSEESAMKYFLLGAFSSAIFVFGIALTYGATGTTSLPLVMESISGEGVFATGAVAFILVGLAFKVAAAPFHMWTPDVYEGAPTATVAFMSVGSKVAGFAALLRIFLVAFPNLGDGWIGAMAILATLTLIVGNVVAIAQQNIKRLLAYSSIAHAGYVLIALATVLNSQDGVSSVLFYLFVYLFSNLGAFAVVIALERKQGEGVLLEDYKGLFKRSPGWALAMSVFLLSLAGIPPTAGFVAKFYIFRAAVDAGMVWLAIVGVVTAVISAYYYLRVIYFMFMFDGDVQVATHPVLKWSVVVLAVLTIWFGLMPNILFEITQQAALPTVVRVLVGG